MFWLSLFGIKAVTMATCYVITGRYIPHFSLNTLYFPTMEFFHTFPHHGNDIARHFDLVKSQPINQSKTLFNFEFVDSKIANISEENKSIR